MALIKIGSNGLDTGVGGKVLQVVSINKTDTASSTSTSMVDISGLSLSITPSSSSNKILLLADLMLSESSTGNIVLFNIVKDSTPINTGTTSATYQTTGGIIAYVTSPNDGNSAIKQSSTFLDSPATTSATTYKIQWQCSGGTIYLNRRAQDTYVCFTSSLTAMEIAG
jgi:hypothetical protein